MIPYRLVERVAAVQANELKAECDNASVSDTVPSVSSGCTDIEKDPGSKIPVTE